RHYRNRRSDRFEPKRRERPSVPRRQGCPKTGEEQAMSRHLTEDQISRWFVGRSSAAEQNHIESCGACASELDHFRKTLDSFRSAVTDRADRLTTRNSAHTLRVMAEHPWTLLETPSLLASLRQIVRDTLYPSTTATNVPLAEVKEIWSRPDWRLPRRLSLGL